MTRAYLRLDPHFFERKAIEQGYPAGAVAALVGIFCLAETQPQRGHFRDARLLSALLGSYRRWIPLLLERGDLIEQEAYPRIYVDGWKEWQEGDVTVPERMARLRSRRRGVTPAVTPVDVTPRIAQGAGRRAQGAGRRAQGAGRAAVAPPTNHGTSEAFMGWRPKAPVDPEGGAGLWHGKGTHDGRHGPACAVCAPLASSPPAVPTVEKSEGGSA